MSVNSRLLDYRSKESILLAKKRNNLESKASIQTSKKRALCLVTDTKVALSKDHFWYFQIKIKFRKKLWGRAASDYRMLISSGLFPERIPESSCARTETVDIDILVTSRNGDKKIMKSIRITRPPSKKKGSGTSWASSEKHLPNTYRKDLSWSHFADEPMVQEKQQMKDQQSCIFALVACLTIPSSN